MRRTFALLTAIILVFLALTACTSAVPPTVVAQNPTATATNTPTPAPTVSSPTRTPSPTLGPPTSTPTRVVKTPTATPIGAKQTSTAAAVEALPPAPAATIAASPRATATSRASATPTASPSPTSPPPPPTPTPEPTATPLPTVTHAEGINPLTGLPVPDPSVLKRRPLMVRIGNDVGARPQRGLNEADMVYEEITEWWITRFSAIYLSQTPEMVGPIRSARLINLQLAPQYGAALAHSGGSDPVRWEISQAPITNLDQFFSPDPYEHLPNEGWQTRAVFKPQVARAYLAKKGWEAAVPLQGFLFSDTVEGGEPGENIYIYYPRSTCFTEWHYDAATGKYLRWIIGSPLMDAIDGKQVSAANVIVYFAEHQDTDIVEDSNGATSVRIIVNGRGPAWFFRDGKLNKGFWETDGTRTPFFTYEDGRPYSLKPGNTWVEVVPPYYIIGLNSAEEASSGPYRK
jgi:hypothetical protein